MQIKDGTLISLTKTEVAIEAYNAMMDVTEFTDWHCIVPIEFFMLLAWSVFCRLQAAF